MVPLYSATALLLALMPGVAFGQAESFVVPFASDQPAVWTLYVDGSVQDWNPGSGTLSAIDDITDDLLARLRHEGYPFATVDSVHVDSTAQPDRVTLYVSRGAAVEVDRVDLTGNQAISEGDLRSLMETRSGRRFSPAQLEADLEALLHAYERRGYLLSEIQVLDVELTPDMPFRASISLLIREGPRSPLKGIELAGAERTRTGYAARVAGIRPGEPLSTYEPEQIRQRLLDTGHFQQVGTPEVRVEEDSAAVLVIPVEEAPPGLFDVVLGYQPGNGSRGGRIVGTGHLVMSNLFGAGLGASLRLNRLPGQVSRVETEFSDPLLPYVPFGVSVRFEGLQDSTFYSRQRYRGEVSYRLSRGVEARASLSRERTRPGQAGTELLAGRQRVPRAHALFWGLGLIYRRVDRLQNPRRGAWFEIGFEQGSKERRFRTRSVSGDTTVERTHERQARFSGRGRLFIPTFPRHVLVLGMDANLLQSDTYDPSDLYRFGGATTLRGYDEDRFLGRLVSRTLLEYRYQLDAESFAFVFTDIGYVELPDRGGSGVERGMYPGFGFGMQFDTAIGMVNTSYAANREGGQFSGRIHVGLSFGL